MTGTAFEIARITCTAYRFPNPTQIETSFGVMRDRPAVFLRVEDRDGAFGYGEIFANWPAAGAEHRVNLLHWDVAPLFLGGRVEDPDATFMEMSRRTHIRSLQCGEPGPFAQVLAGLDIALWDLAARRAGVPLRRLLNPEAPDGVDAYASGIHVAAATSEVENARALGFARFKVKVGFNADADAALVLETVAGLAPGETLAADANQGWRLNEAVAAMSRLDPLGLEWIEEPLVCDRPAAEWARLRQMIETPIAAGENIMGFRGFHDAIASGNCAVLQPDVIKWGGVSGNLRVARAALAAGRRYCPHFLGGGVGLAASAEILAAAGGSGALEVDANFNPLRETVLPAGAGMVDGSWQLAQAPGLGIEALPADIERWKTAEIDLRA